MSDATQVPLSMVISIISGSVTLLVGALVFVARYAYTNDLRSESVRIDTLVEHVTKIENETRASSEVARVDRDNIRERLHADELTTLRVDNAVSLVKNNHDKLAKELEEIRRTMVTKDLFDQSIQNLRAQLTQILQQVQRYPSQPRMPAVAVPRSDPPR